MNNVKIITNNLAVLSAIAFLSTRKWWHKNATGRLLLFERILLAYASLLSDHDETLCWANLVMWAMGYRRFRSLFFRNDEENDYHNQLCRQSEDGKNYAYCGKCETTKRFYLTSRNNFAH